MAARRTCARAPHQAAAARQEAHGEMKEEKMESRPGHGPQRRSLRGAMEGGGAALGRRMPPLPLLLSFFPNSSLAHRRLAAHAANRSRKRQELGQSICRMRMRHFLFHLDQRAQREVEEEPRPASRRLPPSTHLTAAILSMSWRIRYSPLKSHFCFPRFHLKYGLPIYYSHLDLHMKAV